jgi:hypothetical protein
MQSHSHGLCQVRFADDDRHRSSAQSVTENDEPRRRGAIERNGRLRRDGERFDRSLAEGGHRLCGNCDERRIVGARRGAGGGDQQSRQPLRQLGKLDGGAGICAGRHDFEVACVPAIGGEGKDRSRIMKVADCKADRRIAIEPERPRAAGGNEKIWPRRSTQLPKSEQACIGHAIHRQDQHRFVRRQDYRPSGHVIPRIRRGRTRINY